MKNKKVILGYGVIFILVFILDRVTKEYALSHFSDPYIVNQFVSFELVINRGVTAGLFHTYSDVYFLLLNIFICLIIIGLAFYTYILYRRHENIFGNILVLSGAISNVIDRILYKGVVDFILLSSGSLAFPVFNIADMCIVVGVGIMLLTHLKD